MKIRMSKEGETASAETSNIEKKKTSRKEKLGSKDLTDKPDTLETNVKPSKKENIAANKKDSTNDSNKEPSKEPTKDDHENTPQSDGEESGDDESEEENEYEIEKIVGHKITKGKVVKYEIKWKDYPEDDNTMERATTIHDDAYELCEKYWDTLDIARPTNAPGHSKDSKKRKPGNEQLKRTEKKAKKATRPSKGSDKGTEENANLITEHVPRCMIDKGYLVPLTYPSEKTEWREEVKNIAAVQLSPIDKSVMLAYVEWNNGQKTIHKMSEIHEKCPELLVDYYEARLRFV